MRHEGIKQLSPGTQLVGSGVWIHIGQSDCGDHGLSCSTNLGRFLKFSECHFSHISSYRLVAEIHLDNGFNSFIIINKIVFFIIILMEGFTPLR